MFKKLFPLIIVIVAVFYAGFPLFHAGLFPTHDGEYHVIRFYEFDKVLRSGILYPRFAPDLNYGYGVPLFNFVYPLPNYIASIIHIFHISFIDSFKISMFLALLTGAIGMYLWTKVFFGKWGAIISALCYTFAPYHFVDMYIRGSIGEVWSLGLFPIFLWSVTSYKKQKSIFWLIFSSIIFALIVFSHNILALGFAPFAIIYMLIIFWDSKNIGISFFKTFSIFLLGIALSAIFWLPALSETKYTVGLQVFGIASNFPELYQLIIPSWGSGFFGASLENQMSVQIGLANILAVIIGIFALFKLIKHKKDFTVILYFLISFIVLFILMLPISLPIWKSVPLMNYFQFPWRFLSLEILICSFLAGSIILVLPNIIFSLLFAVIIVLLSVSYINPAYFMMRNDNYYTSRSNFIDGTNSPGNAFNTIYVREKLVRSKDKITIMSGFGTLKNVMLLPESYSFITASSQNIDINIHTAYFPGWMAKVDGKLSPVSIASNGSMLIIVPKGEHKISVWFGETLIRKIAFLISLIAAILLLTIGIKNWYSKKK